MNKDAAGRREEVLEKPSRCLAASLFILLSLPQVLGQPFSGPISWATRRARARPFRHAGSSGGYFEAPPHLPVLTLKFPQPSGARQSAIRSFEPSRYGDHSLATTVPEVCHTTLNC